MAKRKPLATDDMPSFETALEELEQLVESLEHDNLPLEELVSRFERGSLLVDHCHSVLTAAKHRIDLITLKSSESGDEEPLPTGDSAHSHTQGSHDGPDDDDIRLF